MSDLSSVQRTEDTVSLDSPLTSPVHLRQSSDDEWEDVSRDTPAESNTATADTSEVKSPVKSTGATNESKDAKSESKNVQLGTGWVATAGGNGQIAKLVLTEGSGEVPPPLARVYVELKGKASDGTYFVNTDHEEMDFIVGHATVASGLEMVLVDMKPGEVAAVRVGPDFGYSNSRRPSGVKAGDKLEFHVKLVRWEKEKNLHEMTDAEKFEYSKQRRVFGNELFEQKKFASAARQYEKALTVLENMGETLSTEQRTEKKQLQVLFLVNQAACRMRLNEYSEVIPLASKALDASPGHLKALWLRARALHARGQLEEARRDYTAILEAPDADEKAKASTAKCLQALVKERSALTEKQKKAFAGVFSNKQGAKVSLYDDKEDVITPASASFFQQLLSYAKAPIQWLRSLCKRPSVSQSKKRA